MHGAARAGFKGSGCQLLLVIGYWFLVIGHWSLVIGHWSLVIGHWSLVTGHWSLVTGHWSLVIGHWSLAGCRLSVVGLAPQAEAWGYMLSPLRGEDEPRCWQVVIGSAPRWHFGAS